MHVQIQLLIPAMSYVFEVCETNCLLHISVPLSGTKVKPFLHAYAKQNYLIRTANKCGESVHSSGPAIPLILTHESQ